MKKILIIDDDPNLILFMEKKLRDAGHEVVSAPDGLTAMQKLVDYTPDMIFTDYFLPAINGDALCRIFRKMEHLKETYLTVMSAAAKELKLDPSTMAANALIAKGTFRDTAEHFFSAIEDAERPRNESPERAVTLGMESVVSRRMTVELLERRRHLQTVLDSISEGIIEISRERIVYVNPAALAILDREQDELLAASPSTLLDDAHQPDLEAILKSETIEGRVVRLKGPGEGDGKILSIKKVAPSGDPDTIVLVVADITERVHAEETRLSYQAHLEALVEERTADLKHVSDSLHQAQKMEAVGTLAGGIAHDFNNILTVLVGYGTLLQMEMDKDNPLRIYVDQILSSTEKAAQLTQGLLAFSRKQPITLKPVTLNTLIDGTKTLLKRLLTEDIELRARLTPDETSIMGDVTQIDQILFNLATNARDAMPGGGVLLIETKQAELDRVRADELGCDRPGTFIEMSVSDTGCGMDRETRAHVFDPFFTTKEVGKGTGLGLSTVYGIVKQHNGAITVESEPERGTVFRVYLPFVKQVVEEETPQPVSVRGGKETILIAEDNEAVRLLMSKVLSGYGYRAIEAANGLDAVEQFKKVAGIDLLILDSVMPKMNGREVYDEICRIRPGTPVIFTSGYTKDVFLDKGIEDGRVNFIHKPVSPTTLLQKVREALEAGSGPPAQ